MPDTDHAMTGNVQGFDLPRGCLFTTGVILMLIVSCAGALALLLT